MLYLIDLNYINYKSIILCSIVILLIIISVIIHSHGKKYNDGKNILQQSMIMCICVFMAIVFSIVSICSISQQVYAVHSYNINKYSVAEGEIKDFEYIYANNSNIAIGIRFIVNDKRFEINNGFFNIGYDIDNNIINCNGQKFKIYYLVADDAKIINTIIRIDAME